MSMKKFVDDEVLTAAELNSSFGKSLRQTGQVEIAQLQDRAVTSSADGGQFAEAYIDADGRNNSVVAADTTAEFDTDKYKTASPGASYVVIEATSISSRSDFQVNGCDISEIDTGKWLLYYINNAVDGDEVARANVYETLFRGTDGTDARASSTYITGISALKTSVTRDVGLQAHFTKISTTTPGGSGTKTATYTGTFANTSTNTVCSSWSTLNTTNSTVNSYWENPSSTILNTGSDGTSNEYGLDKSADEKSNPATCRFRLVTTSASPYGASGDAVVICNGDITWAYSEDAAFIETVSNIDFLTDNSIPVFTAATENNSSTITHTIPTGTFGSTLSSAFATFKAEDWESGADVQYKLTNATEDTGWLSTNEV